MRSAARSPRHTQPLSKLAQLCALALLVALILASASDAQTFPQLGGTQAAPAAEAEPPPDATERIEQVRTELNAARARLENASEEASGILSEEVQILERIEGVLRQQLATADLIETEQSDTRDLAEQVDLVVRSGIAEEGPYGFLLLETLRDRHQDEAQHLKRLNDAVRLASEDRDSARKAVDSKERARRQAREAADSQTTPSSNALRLARRAELESRFAQEQLVLKSLELERNQAGVAAQSQRVLLAKAELDYVADSAELTQEDRDRIKTDLSVREMRAKADAEVARQSQKYATDRSIKARIQAEESGGNDPVVLAEVDAHEAELARRRLEVEMLEKRLEGLAEMRSLWEQRFEVFANAADRREMLEWCDAAEGGLRTVNDRRDLYAAYMGDVRKRLITTDAQIEATTDAEILRWLRQKRTAEAAQVDFYESILSFQSELQRVHEKLLDDTRVARSSFDFAGYLQRAWDWLINLWSWEITSVGDNSITLKKIALGLVILLLGGFMAKRISQFFGSRILPNFGLNQGALHAFESLLFYLLVITFALFALKVVNIPLTAFTIVGGALAIGFGFGSQNIVNNFISGLILLTEQPVRVADLIQIGDNFGTVQHIGLRSTRIRSGDNVELIVPNSSFLEQNVINWTLTNTKTRIHVTVGVSYGSNTRKVKDLLKRAASEHGKVLKSPEPVVLFKDFGDNSLVFEVHFWIHMKKLLDRQMLESDVRFRIDSLCRDANITIAFPQRDVHLDSMTPIQVQVVSPAEDSEADTETPPPTSLP